MRFYFGLGFIASFLSAELCRVVGLRVWSSWVEGCPQLRTSRHDRLVNRVLAMACLQQASDFRACKYLKMLSSSVQVPSGPVLSGLVHPDGFNSKLKEGLVYIVTVSSYTGCSKT